MNTPQPTVIDGTSRTSIAVTIAIAMIVFAIGGSVAVGQSRIVDLESKSLVLEKVSVDHDRRVQRIEDNYAHIVRALEKLDAKIDDLAKRP